MEAPFRGYVVWMQCLKTEMYHKHIENTLQPTQNLCDDKIYFNVDCDPDCQSQDQYLCWKPALVMLSIEMVMIVIGIITNSLADDSCKD